MVFTTLNITDSIICIFLGQKLEAWSSLKAVGELDWGCTELEQQTAGSAEMNAIKQVMPSLLCQCTRVYAYIHIQITAKANTRLLNAVYASLQHSFLFECFELHVLRKWSRSQQSHVLHYLNKWFKVLFYLLLWLLSSSLPLCIPSPASAVENVWLHMSSL